MANTPADYSDTLERAADSYAKNNGGLKEKCGSKVELKLKAKLGSEMVANANERAAVAAIKLNILFY